MEGSRGGPGVRGGPGTQPVPAVETSGSAGRQRGGRGHFGGREADGLKVLWEMGPVHAAERRLTGPWRGPKGSCGKHAGAVGPDQTLGRWAWNLIGRGAFSCFPLPSCSQGEDAN